MFDSKIILATSQALDVHIVRQTTVLHYLPASDRRIVVLECVDPSNQPYGTRLLDMGALLTKKELHITVQTTPCFHLYSSGAVIIRGLE